MSEQFVADRISLGILAPEMVESICAGTQPENLTADALEKPLEIPLSLSEQTARLLQPREC